MNNLLLIYREKFHYLSFIFPHCVRQLLIHFIYTSFTYVYIHSHTYTHTYTYIQAHTHKHIYTHIHTRTHLHTYIPTLYLQICPHYNPCPSEVPYTTLSTIHGRGLTEVRSFISTASAPLLCIR